MAHLAGSAVTARRAFLQRSNGRSFLAKRVHLVPSSPKFTSQSQGVDRTCKSATAQSTALTTQGDEAKPFHFWRVVVPTSLVLLVCNMDRICMSVAIIPMSQAFGWSPSVQGLLGSAFLWGYMTTQLLGGRAADRYGGKRVIGLAIVFFSLASMIPAIFSHSVPVAAVLGLVAASRFLVGVGEGVVLPSMNTLVATHVSPPAKARALGLIFTGFHCGNLVGLVLTPAIISAFGWKVLFLMFGLFGAPLLALWLLVQPNGAPTQRKGDAPETPRRATVPLRDLLGNHAIQAIAVANFVNHWGYFIFLSWIPSFFSSMYGMNVRASSFMAFAPWVAMAVGSSIAGVAADHMVEMVRKALQVAAFIGPAFALLALTIPNISAQVSMVLFTVALGVQSLGQAGFVANMSDVAPFHAGQVFGLCNTFGSLAGILGVSVAGLLYEVTGSFNTLFYVSAGLYIIGAAIFAKLARGDAQFDSM